MPQKGFVKAVDLRAGDYLWNVNGQYVIIEIVQHYILEKGVKVYNFEVCNSHTYYVGTNTVLVHNSCSKNPQVAQPEKVNNALKDYNTKCWNVDGNELQFDKSGMKHVLTRHHPDFWDGSVKAKQSFFDGKLSISDIQRIAGEVITQNRGIISQKGTNGMYQIEGVVDGIDYVVGINNGRIGQLYPK